MRPLEASTTSARIPLGDVLGAEMALHYSAPLAALLLVLSLGWRFQYLYPDWNTTALWATAILVALIYGLSLGIRGLVQLALLRGFGCSPRLMALGAMGVLTESPDRTRPLRTGLTAIAGIGTNLLLALVCLGLASMEGSSPARIPSTPLVALLVWSGYVNLFLAVLNVLPGLPLDGGRIVCACIQWGTGRSDQALRLATGSGQIIGGLMMLLGGFRLLTNAPFDGAWLLILGWFIFEGAQESDAQAGKSNRTRAA